MAATCRLVGSGGAATASDRILGAELDGAPPAGQLGVATQHTALAHRALSIMEGLRTELALLRASADARRIVHRLCAAGPEVDPAVLDAFEHAQRLALAAWAAFFALCVWRQYTAEPATPLPPPWRVVSPPGRRPPQRAHEHDGASACACACARAWAWAWAWDT